MDIVNIKVVNKSKFSIPEYKKIGDSGMDVRANIENNIVLKPLERVLILTGLFFEIPKGFEIQVRPRSGNALNRGLTVLNTPGTIDSNYRGELGVIIVNLSNEEQIIEPGERIAQIVCSKVETIKLQEVSEINTNTERGDTGYGNSGRF